MLSAVLFAGLIQSFCMGKFTLLKSLYTWNEKATDNKFVNNLLFWLLNIVPVYTVVVFADAINFNLIEFWTGTIPMAINVGDRIEKRMQDGNGHEFLAVATKNRMDIVFEKQPENNLALVYDRVQKAWVLETKSKSVFLAKKLDATHLALHQQDGSQIRVEKDFDFCSWSGLIFGRMAAMR